MNDPLISSESPVIARANRLMSLRANPGFQDAFRLSKDMADEAGRISITYGGWDPQQIMVLKARAQAALEHHELFFAKITEAIREGIAEQAASVTLPDKSVQEVLETGDLVRQQVLTRFEEFDSESRLPGSY